MFNINDAYENALIEQNLDDKNNRLDNMQTIDIFEVTPKELLNMKTSKPFIDMYKCSKCNHIFSSDEIEVDSVTISGSTPVYGGFDNYYEEPYSYKEDVTSCPYCGNKNITTLYTDDLDETIVNVDDYIDGFKAYLNTWMELNENKKLESKKLEEDDADYSKLKETVKKEMCKYLKDNGIDVEHLRKAGVELNSMKPVIDKMLDTYVATSIADYENEFNIGLAWDYTIDNNDIIITIENM